MNRVFNLNTYNKLFRENIRNNYYFKIDPLILASKDTEQEAPFWTFIRKYRDVGAIATSMDLTIYMNTSSAIPINRDMLIGVSPATNPNQLAKLYGAKIYVELDAEIVYPPFIIGDVIIPDGVIKHPTNGKIIHQLHPSGRSKMSWEALWQAFQDYGVENLILDTELKAFKEANGYNVEEVI
jgi:hypothetical protein